MTPLKYIGVLLLSLLVSGCDDMYGEDANPPLITEESLADPHVIWHGGHYYLYATAKVSDHYNVFISKDGVNWEKGPIVFAKETDTLWAPNVFHDPVSQKFYLYYSLDFSLGVAVADSPLGPFEELGPLVDDAIDAYVYFEEGSYYLYYATANEGFKTLEQMGQRMFEGMFHAFFSDEDTRIRKKIYAQKMRSPTELEGERVELIEATDDWEKGYSLHVVEGPWLLKEDGIYYLMYSGSPTHESEYGIGYATADNPMGPFTKSADNPILFTSSDASVFGRKVYGPGHHSVVSSKDGTRWIYFHQNEKKFNLGMGNRYTSRGELIIGADRKMNIRLASNAEQ